MCMCKVYTANVMMQVFQYNDFEIAYAHTNIYIYTYTYGNIYIHIYIRIHNICVFWVWLVYCIVDA